MAKLFKCRECGRAFYEAVIYMPVSVTLNADGSFWVNSDLNIPRGLRFAKGSPSDFMCHFCSKEGEINVSEIVEIECPPHIWDEWGDRRECIVCEKKQHLIKEWVDGCRQGE